MLTIYFKHFLQYILTLKPAKIYIFLLVVRDVFYALILRLNQFACVEVESKEVGGLADQRLLIRSELGKSRLWEPLSFAFCIHFCPHHLLVFGEETN